MATETQVGTPQKASGRTAILVWSLTAVALAINVLLTWKELAGGDPEPGQSASSLTGWSMVVAAFADLGRLDRVQKRGERDRMAALDPGPGARGRSRISYG